MNFQHAVPRPFPPRRDRYQRTPRLDTASLLKTLRASSIVYSLARRLVTLNKQRSTKKSSGSFRKCNQWQCRRELETTNSESIFFVMAQPNFIFTYVLFSKKHNACCFQENDKRVCRFGERLFLAGLISRRIARQRQNGFLQNSKEIQELLLKCCSFLWI